MFSITVVDHVRMDSDHVAQNYTVHARAAERFARMALWFRIVVVCLLAVVTVAAIGNLLFPSRLYQIATIATSVLALIAFVVYAVVAPESRVAAHRVLAHRLWLVSERYRSLVAEIDEGRLDPAALLRRRDELIHDVHAIYEHGFGADQFGYESARLPSLVAREVRAA